MNRDKSGKFVELANKRVNKAIKDIKLIANLSNRQNYEFTEEQAKKIIKAIKEMKVKVEAQIQEVQIRVNGKKFDDLQAVMAMCRVTDFEVPLQFENMKS